MKCYFPCFRFLPAVLVTFFLVSMGLKVQGQELAPRIAVAYEINRLDSLSIPHTQVGIGLFAEGFTHAGAMLTFERLLAGKQRERTTRRGKYKKTTYGISAVMRMGAYQHRRNHTGFNAWPGINLTRMNKNGWFFSLGLFAGYQHRFLNEDTYSVNDAGEVTRIRGAGNPLLATGFSTRMGKNMAVKRGYFPWSWYLGSNTYWVMPNNNFAVQQGAFEFGILYDLNLR